MGPTKKLEFPGEKNETHLEINILEELFSPEEVILTILPSGTMDGKKLKMDNSNFIFFLD